MHEVESEKDNAPVSTGPAGYELSPQQRRIWPYYRNECGPNTSTTYELAGTLDIDLLNQSVEHIVETYEILRTRFRRVPGRGVPVQVVYDEVAPEWHIIDLEGLSPDLQALRIQEILEEELTEPFLIETGSVFRLVLLRLGVDRHLLSLCLPSICADSTSMQILVRAIASLYAGSESPGQNEPLQYVDLSEWQNQLLATENDGDPGPTFWRQQDLDVPDVRLPFEMHPEEADSLHILTVARWLDRSIADRILHAAVSADILPSAVLAGCWHALLWGLTGTSDIVIHHCVDGRSDEDLKNAVGPLERALPIRVVIDPGAPASRLWRRTNRAIIDARSTVNYWNWRSQAVDNGSSAPAFGFRFDEAHSALVAGQTTFNLRNISGFLEPFRLRLSCLSAAEGMTIEIAYDARRFRSADVQQITEYFCVLLDNMLLKPDVPVASLSMLTHDERHKLLVEWNDTSEQYPHCRCIHELFEEHVKRAPDAIALICESDQLTYRQLNARANQLANLLLAKGVVPDMPVGLCLERSADLIVGMLGILKAGGAYLPLDPSLPHERLRGMLTDSGASVFVSNIGLACGLSGESVMLDRDARILSEQGDLDPQSAVRENHLAYVIYTSGSTGRPKGVAIEHRNLLNYVFSVGKRLGLATGAAYATVSTLSADLGHTTLFSSLCMGGCLHLISPPSVRWSPLLLAGVLCRSPDPIALRLWARICRRLLGTAWSLRSCCLERCWYLVERLAVGNWWSGLWLALRDCAYLTITVRQRRQLVY